LVSRLGAIIRLSHYQVDLTGTPDQVYLIVSGWPQALKTLKKYRKDPKSITLLKKRETKVCHTMED
jgi:hypothetical protein